MKSSSKKVALGLIIAAGLAAGGLGFMMFNKQHADLNETSADITISAIELYEAFEQDEVAASAEYVDKLILVSGTIEEFTETEGGGVLLVLREEAEMFGVNCSFLPDEKNSLQGVQIGSEIRLKGLCSGSTIGGVELSRCVLAQ